MLYGDVKMKETKLKCPNCGHDRFLRKSDDIVEMIDNGEAVRDELLCDRHNGCEYYCQKCGNDVTDEEMAR